jgi:hypothetical protein
MRLSALAEPINSKLIMGVRCKVFDTGTVKVVCIIYRQFCQYTESATRGNSLTLMSQQVSLRDNTHHSARAISLTKVSKTGSNSLGTVRFTGSERGTRQLYLCPKAAPLFHPGLRRVRKASDPCVHAVWPKAMLRPPVHPVPCQ